MYRQTNKIQREITPITSNCLSVSARFGIIRFFSNSEQLKNVFGYIEQKYQERIRMENITQRLIVNFLNDHRIGFVCR